jgi:hypothetical protein
MKKLNKVLVLNKFMTSFWSFERSYYQRGYYNRFYRHYRRLKKLNGLEQYINQNN